MFIAITMNHLRAVKAWADAHQAQATLDLSSFVLEVKARNRYYRLFPQFLAEVQGRMSHVTTLSAQATAFIGWRPYQPLTLSWSSDKLVFKEAVARAGLLTPAHWLAVEQAQADFVLKRSVGSFGYQLAGPYQSGRPLPGGVPTAMTAPDARGRLYAEAFVQGQNLKVWFWAGRPVHAQCQPYAVVQGDGRRTVLALLTQRLEDSGQAWSTYSEREAVVSSLAYQDVALDTVLSPGQAVWLDYRYGRSFSQAATTEAEDNAWPRLGTAVQAQIEQAGTWLAQEVAQELKAPVLCSMDGVLDRDGQVWWLELNSNPICPPTAYFAMLASLFGTAPEAPAGAFSRTVRAPRRSAARSSPDVAPGPAAAIVPALERPSPPAASVGVENPLP
ncbi:MAG: hypothetical protein V4739_17710 [Pseudomonadota bacterium]